LSTFGINPPKKEEGRNQNIKKDEGKNGSPSRKSRILLLSQENFIGNRDKGREGRFKPRDAEKKKMRTMGSKNTVSRGGGPRLDSTAQGVLSC